MRDRSVAKIAVWMLIVTWSCLFASQFKPKASTIYTGPGIDVSVINSECKARNAGESVWIDCDVFFGDKD